ncbi:MAG: type II toxin-antitoxin system VapC family toxin [Armatimonadota bacterium]
MNVFIDTSAFYALLVRADLYHLDAGKRWDSILDDPNIQLFTSNYIVVETSTLLRKRLGMDALLDLTRNILPAVTVLWIDESIHFAATEAVLSSGKHGPSLVDCSSFALMHEHGITQAFAYDAHFTKQGF